MRSSAAPYRAFAAVLLLFAAALPALAGVSSPGDVPASGAFAERWAAINRLTNEDKLAAASVQLDSLIADARAAGDEEDWTRALLQAVQLRAQLGRPTEAVDFLRGQPWPAGAVRRASLDLLYAHLLGFHLRTYRWQIVQRPAVEADESLPLEQWPAERIAAAARASCDGALALRAELGAVPARTAASWLDPGDYPERVRPTLRDAATYLCAALFDDRALWTDDEREELYNLDLPALMTGPGGEAPAAAHPLARMATVLADLEAWHLAAGRREAALEARLERARRLHAAADDDEERGRLDRGLAESLPAFRDLPWWSMGQATLAELRSRSTAPGHLAAAHEAAVAGWNAWPGSPGGERCRALAAEIEDPWFYLQGTTGDALGRRSLQVRHRNLAALHFRAYAVDLRLAMERTAFDWSDSSSITLLLAQERPAAEWRAELPATPDFEDHLTYVTPPLGRPGAYVIVASRREDFGREDNDLQAVPLVLGDLALVSRALPTGRREVLALSGATGEPLAGVKVALWGAYGHPLAEETTGADGTVIFAEPEDVGTRVTAERPGEVPEVAFADGFPRREPDRADKPAEALVYTDRAIYRPGQTLRWKVLAYRGSPREGRFSALAGEAVRVRLLDANSQVVAERTMKTGRFGTAAGELAIPAGRLLGSWRLEGGVLIPGAKTAYASVQVEEYKRPTFEVSVADPAAPPALGRKASLRGRAVYYFGLPVTRGRARWTVTRTAAESWERPWYHRSYPPGRVVATGTAELGGDGGFEIPWTPAVPAGAPPSLRYDFRVALTVTDEGDETREGERTFRLGPAAVEAALVLDAGFLRAGRPATVTAVRRDLDGLPRAGNGAWTLRELRQPPRALLPDEIPEPVDEDGAGFRTPGDSLRPRGGREAASPEEQMAGWEEGWQVAEGELRHGADGRAEVRLPALPPGAYRLTYETRDAAGVRVEARRDLLVAGEAAPLALAGVLRAERRSVPAGGTVRLLAGTGLPGQIFFFEVWRGGARLERRVLRGAGGPEVVEVPVTARHRGGLAFRLLLMRDHQIVDLSETVDVPWERGLEVSFATFRDRLRPGDRETWRVTVRAPKGSAARAPEAAAAEVLALMTDRSLDAFVPYGMPDPLALSPNLARGAATDASVAESYVVWSVAGRRPEPVRGLWPQGLRGVVDVWWPRRDRARFGELRSVDGVVQQDVQVVASAPMLDERRISTGATVRETVESHDNLLAEERSPAGHGGEPRPAVALRSDFSETAFWQPQLLTERDGSVTIEFTAPGSVTSWNLWVQAVTRDLRAGTVKREVRTVRDLLARPALPRFLREGDRAELKVVLTSAAKATLRGEVTLDVEDPETGESRLADFGLGRGPARRPFTLPAGGGGAVTFPLMVPRGAGTVAFRVTATAGDESDGELRPLPILPSRVELAESRTAVMREPGRRELRFPDLEANGDGDPTRVDERLVVTVDGQLFEGMLAALPYLQSYPYECAEQTLNRFLSAGILASLFDAHPGVAKLAADLAKRDTPLEVWDATDANRRLALEESPFLAASRGGDRDADFLRVLDPRVARAERDSGMAKLVKSQLPGGAFPWWPGGPADDYMTIYVLQGFARAAEYGIDVPKDAVRKGWSYLAARRREEDEKRRLSADCCLDVLVFLNYVASSYPDPSWMGDALNEAERRTILDDTFARWRDLPLRSRALLALTLKRMGRPEDAQLVFDSVMDRARTTPEEGIFWQPEARSWLWVHDTVETHAFALRTLMELRPDDPRRHGLAQWLFLQKKLNHWTSTRSTAEVLYALAAYLRKEGTLGASESATVRIGGRATTFTFEPDRYTGGHNQLVVPGDKLDASSSPVVVEKPTPGFLIASATWHYSTDAPVKEGKGDLFAVSRRYFQVVPGPAGGTLRPLADGTSLQPGDEVEVQLSIASRAPAEYVHLRDPRPAGLEPGIALSGWRWDLGLMRYQETRDSATSFFFGALPAGEYTLSYRLRAALAGEFRVGPATLQSMYAPELTAYSTGAVVRVGE